MNIELHASAARRVASPSFPSLLPAAAIWDTPWPPLLAAAVASGTGRQELSTTTPRSLGGTSAL